MKQRFVSSRQSKVRFYHTTVLKAASPTHIADHSVHSGSCPTTTGFRNNKSFEAGGLHTNPGDQATLRGSGVSWHSRGLWNEVLRIAVRWLAAVSDCSSEGGWESVLSLLASMGHTPARLEHIRHFLASRIAEGVQLGHFATDI